MFQSGVFRVGELQKYAILKAENRQVGRVT